MLIIDDNTLHSFETDPNDVVDFVETLFTRRFSLSLFQVKFEVLDCPLAAVLVVVGSILFCDRNICQVNKHVFALIAII